MTVHKTAADRQQMRQDAPSCPSNDRGGRNGLGHAPGFLNATARKLWALLLQELPHLEAADGQAVAAYCVCWDRWIQAEAMIDKSGLILDGTLNPAVKVAESMLRHLRYYGQELGLSPLARKRIEASREQDAPDDFEQFLLNE